MLTVEQVCDYLQISKTTIYRWVKAGQIRFYKAGAKLRFKKEDIEAFLHHEQEHNQK